MPTPEQVKKHSFRSAGKGLYRSEDVDPYFKEVAQAYAAAAEHEAELQKSNDELYQRVEALANALNQLRAERELIQKTMILAQKAADEISGRAKEESEKLTAGARAEAERLRKESREEAAKLLGAAKAEVDKMLLETQAQAENIQAQAKARAETLFEEARAKAQQELTRISGETQREQQTLQRLRQETAVFRNRLLDLVSRQMELIEQIEEPIQEAGNRRQGTGERIEMASALPAEEAGSRRQEERIEMASALPAEEEGNRRQESGERGETVNPPPAEAHDMFAELEAALGHSEEGFQFVK
ncbi:MAG: DivIVA domain-containing protein [Oscillospiraceae bacterium]|jgi:cell division septum initiation protein DivIVA|nr:DivIVA domain-containing protein [Oscillospiraceae bacterium]